MMVEISTTPGISVMVREDLAQKAVLCPSCLGSRRRVISQYGILSLDGYQITNVGQCNVCHGQGVWFNAQSIQRQEEIV